MSDYEQGYIVGGGERFGCCRRDLARVLGLPATDRDADDSWGVLLERVRTRIAGGDAARLDGIRAGLEAASKRIRDRANAKMLSLADEDRLSYARAYSAEHSAADQVDQIDPTTIPATGKEAP